MDEFHHGGFAIEHGLIHVDINNQGAIFYLGATDFKCFFEGFIED